MNAIRPTELVAMHTIVKALPMAIGPPRVEARRLTEIGAIPRPKTVPTANFTATQSPRSSFGIATSATDVVVVLSAPPMTRNRVRIATAGPRLSMAENMLAAALMRDSALSADTVRHGPPVRQQTYASVPPIPGPSTPAASSIDANIVPVWSGGRPNLRDSIGTVQTSAAPSARFAIVMPTTSTAKT